MKDVRVAETAGRQFNRISRAQLLELGLSPSAIQHRVARCRLLRVEQGVFALPPLIEHDEWGRRMEATLTAPNSFLSHVSAASARGWWAASLAFEIVTRPGSGGPRRHGGVLVHHAALADQDRTQLRGIPITSPERTLIDLARHVSDRELARALREAVRLEDTTLPRVGDALGRFQCQRGSARLAAVVARYAGLPLSRARSGAEVRAMEVLRDAGRPMPKLNTRIANEEADLSWAAERLIIEIDGGPFHRDVGEDARKEAAWRAFGWAVRRLSSEDVYERPELLLSLAPG